MHLPKTDRSTPIRVGFFVTHSDPGGVQQLWANLSREFANSGSSSSLFALYPYQDSDTDAGLPFDYVSTKRPKGPLSIAALFFHLVQLLKRKQYDVVFTAMPAANVLVPLARALAGARTRIITSHHTPADTYSAKLRKLDFLLGRTRLIERIVAVSKSVSNSLASTSATYRSKIEIIHNALPEDVEQRLRVVAAKRDWSLRTRTVIATGRLAEQKNYPVIIRTARHLPDVSFVIVGSGPEETNLRNMAMSYGVGHSVSFLGQKTRAETLDLLAGSDIFFQPSLFEGHSLALLEAAKLGVPIVVSDVPVQVEGVSLKNGELCGRVASLHDDKAFAQIIRELLENEEAFAAAREGAAALGNASTFSNMYSAYQTLALKAAL